MNLKSSIIGITDPALKYAVSQAAYACFEDVGLGATSPTQMNVKPFQNLVDKSSMPQKPMGDKIFDDPGTTDMVNDSMPAMGDPSSTDSAPNQSDLARGGASISSSPLARPSVDAIEETNYALPGNVANKVFPKLNTPQSPQINPLMQTGKQEQGKVNFRAGAGQLKVKTDITNPAGRYGDGYYIGGNAPSVPGGGG